MAEIGRRRSSQRLTRHADHALTEPGSRYIDFFLPGLLGMNLMGGGLFGIGFVIVDMRVRKLLKHFFKDRDCFVVVRPTENEKLLQNLNRADSTFLTQPIGP